MNTLSLSFRKLFGSFLAAAGGSPSNSLRQNALPLIAALFLFSCGAAPAAVVSPVAATNAPAVVDSAPASDGVQRSGLLPAVAPAAESAESLTEAMQVFAAENEGRTLHLSVHGSTPDAGLRVSCPVAVRCDADFDYRAYRGGWDGMSMYMSFSPDVIGHLDDLQVVRDSFAYVNFDLGFPELETGSWRVVESHAGFRIFRHGAPEVHIESVQDGRIQGTIVTTIDGLRAVDTSCAQMMDGPETPGCSASVSSAFGVEIDFDLALEDITVLDCHAAENRDRCG